MPAPKSAQLMKMRFMQRNKAPAAQEEKPQGLQALSPKPVVTAPQEETPDKSGDLPQQKCDAKDGKSKDLIWTHKVKLPAPCPRDGESKQLEVDPKLQVLARRSFGGFNLAVERAYEEMRDDPLSKRNKRLEKHAVSDIEMANFYMNRVGSYEKTQSGGGKKVDKNKKGKPGGGGNRISGGGGSSQTQKRKRR